MATYYVELDGGELSAKTTLKGGNIAPKVAFSGAQIYPTSGSGGGATLETLNVSYTPSETAISDTQTPSSGYDGFDEVNVTVGAISSSYVGSAVPRKTSSNLTASGATVTAPAGYYENSASKSVASGSAQTPATSITANPTITVSNGGLITATASATKSITPTVTAGYVSSGTSGTVTVSGSNTSQLTTKGATTYTPSTSDQTIASGQYLTGTQTIKGDAYLIASNIKNGVTIFGVTGTYSGGGWVEQTISDSGAVTQALDPYTIYHFTGNLTSLTITLNTPSAGVIAHYHFDFISGSTAPTLTMPNSVTMPDSFAVEASNRYEVDVLNNFGTVVEWANS